MNEFWMNEWMNELMNACLTTPQHRNYIYCRTSNKSVCLYETYLKARLYQLFFSILQKRITKLNDLLDSKLTFLWTMPQEQDIADLRNSPVPVSDLLEGCVATLTAVGEFDLTHVTRGLRALVHAEQLKMNACMHCLRTSLSGLKVGFVVFPLIMVRYRLTRHTDIHTHTYIYIYTHIYPPLYIYMCVCVIYIYIYIYIYMCVCVCVYIYIYVCVCMYIYIYIWCDGLSDRSFIGWTHWAISRSSQCSTTGVTKAVVCAVLSVGRCI